MINRKRSDFRVFNLHTCGNQLWKVQEIVGRDAEGRGTFIDWPQAWATLAGAQSAIDELFDADVDSEEPDQYGR